jgi:hypothetical protein
MHVGCGGSKQANKHGSFGWPRFEKASSGLTENELWKAQSFGNALNDATPVLCFVRTVGNIISVTFHAELDR